MAAPGRLPRLEPQDDPHRFGGRDGTIAQSLDSLRIANRYFGGARSVLHPLGELLRSDPAGVIRILDVGCGGADVPRALVAWARRRGRRVHVTAVEENAAVVARARLACRAWPEIQVVRADATRLPFPEHSFEYVISSMLLHYFGLAEAAALLAAWRRLATRAVVVADVRRHWLPCLAIDVLGRAWASPLFRDAHKRTVRRGFTPGELRRVGGQAGFARTRVHRHVPFRLSLVGLP